MEEWTFKRRLGPTNIITDDVPSCENWQWGKHRFKLCGRVIKVNQNRNKYQYHNFPDSLTLYQVFLYHAPFSYPHIHGLLPDNC